jgi:hypothetical protein
VLDLLAEVLGHISQSDLFDFLLNAQGKLGRMQLGFQYIDKRS